jgi:hypothetical protein
MPVEFREINKIDYCTMTLILIFSCLFCATDIPIRLNASLNYTEINQTIDTDINDTNFIPNYIISTNKTHNIKYYYDVYSTNCDYILKSIFYYKLCNLLSYFIVLATGLIFKNIIFVIVYGVLLFINLLGGSIIKYNDINSGCYREINHEYKHEQNSFFINVLFMWLLSILSFCVCCGYKRKLNNDKTIDINNVYNSDDTRKLLPDYNAAITTNTNTPRYATIIYSSQPPNYQEKV